MQQETEFSNLERRIFPSRLLSLKVYIFLPRGKREDITYLAPRCPPLIFALNSKLIFCTSFGSTRAPGPTRIHNNYIESSTQSLINPGIDWGELNRGSGEIGDGDRAGYVPSGLTISCCWSGRRWYKGTTYFAQLAHPFYYGNHFGGDVRL